MTSQERRQIVVGLLDHWPDFFEPRVGGVATSGVEPSGIALISPMSRHSSVLELVRLLKGLREQGPGHYRALLGYFEAPWRTTDRPIRRRNAGGRMIDDVARVRERVLPGFLRAYPVCRDRVCGCGLPRPVCTAVDVLASGWDRRVPLELPYALLAKLRPLADSDGWTEAA